jgi:hypothetical protein
MSFSCHSIVLLLYYDIMILLYYYIIILLYYSAILLPPAPPGRRHCSSHARPSAAVLSVAMSSLEAADNSDQSVVDVASPDARPTAAA